MTDEKIEIVAETKIAEEDSKSSTPGLPDYNQATGNQYKNAEEVPISEFRSETLAELFAASQSAAESTTCSSQSLTNQP